MFQMAVRRDVLDGDDRLSSVLGGRRFVGTWPPGAVAVGDRQGGVSRAASR
jgi:hypothetical protein